MTKENRYFLQAYNRSTAKTLSDVYKSFSYAKEKSFNDIWYEMKSMGGHDLRIISHNCNFYSCGYMLGEVMLVVHTPTRRICIKLEGGDV